MQPTSNPPPVPHQSPPPIRQVTSIVQPNLTILPPQPQAVNPQLFSQVLPLPSILPKKNETLAILSLVFSLAPVILIFIPGLNFLVPLTPIAGIILGFIAKSQIHHHPDSFSGSSMATGGIIAGFIAIGLLILLFIVLSIISAIAGAFTTAATNIFSNTLSNFLSQLFTYLK